MDQFEKVEKLRERHGFSDLIRGLFVYQKTTD